MTTFTVLGSRLSQADGEGLVRAYHCTSLNSWLLNLKAEGYLSITNKRVIFYAHGTSFTGQSVMHSEIPIEDVSGINTYKGSYFSITHLLLAFFASILLGGLIGGIVGAIVTYFVSQFRRTPEFNPAIFTPIILGVLGIAIIYSGRSYPKDNVRRAVFIATGASLMAGLGGLGLIAGIVSSLLGANQALEAISFIVSLLALFAGIYTLYTIYQYAKRETMSLTIGSKGGSNTPIAITGVSVLGIFNTAALRALNAEPALEAEKMIKELGAVINDIQSLGNLGAEKWKAG